MNFNLLEPLIIILFVFFGIVFLLHRFLSSKNVSGKRFFLHKKSIKFKLNITFFILFAVLILGTTSVLGFSFYNYTQKEVGNKLEAISLSKAAHIETYLEQNVERFKLVTSRTALRRNIAGYNDNQDKDVLLTINNIVQDAVAPIEEFERICILDLLGGVISATNSDCYIGNHEAEDYFVSGKNTEAVYFIEEDGEYKLFISGPMLLDDKLISVAVVAVKLDFLKEIIQRKYEPSKTGETLIAFQDSSGQRRYPFPRIRQDEGVNTEIRNEKISVPMDVALSGEKNVFYNIEDCCNRRVIASTTFIEAGGLGLVTKIDRSEAFREMRFLFTVFGIIIIIFIVIYFWVLRFMVSLITKPVEKLSEGTKIISSGNIDYKISEDEDDVEVASLAHDFNVMIKAIKKSRAEVDKKVKQQTKEIEAKAQEMEDQQKAILNILEDVEEEKDKTKELANKFQTLTSNIPGVTYRCKHDKDWTMVFLSDHIFELSGHKAEEIINNKKLTYNDIIYDKDKSFVAEKIEQAMKKNKPWEIEYRIQNKSGEILWVAENGRAVKGSSGEIFLDGIIIDISERKKIEADLVESFNELEKFKLAVENASDHIVITDTEGIIVYANSAVEKITGFSSQEIIGQKAGTNKNWGGLMDKKIYKNIWQTIKKDKKTYFGELKNKRKNGEEYDVLVSISPVLDKNNDLMFFVGIERDVTHEKEIDKAKTEFVSLASHQLRTPLSSINWYSEMLIDEDVGKLNEDQMMYVKEIYGGSQRMVNLVNALLNVSRLELGTFVVEPEKTSLLKIADEAVGEIKHQVKNKKQKLIKKYGSKIPDMMLDKKLTFIIFQNLLSNATKYTPEGGKLNLKISKNKKNILVEVTDTGMGIPKKQQEGIFQKLFRADNVRKTDTEGTGLGLYIVKQIVDHAGGRIWFESKVNKGTKFSVELPLSGMKAKSGTKKID